jgi:hypothetical protein
MSLATLALSGRAAIAQAIALQPLYFAWGIGRPEWDEDPEKNHLKEILIHKTALEMEIGRRRVTFAGFAAPDDNGDIAVPIGRQTDGTVEQARYLSSESPTPNLYIRVNFDYDDANDQIIREAAIFLGGQAADDLPPGLRYFKPDQLTDPGLLLALQRLDPVIQRSPAVKQSFEFVLPI